MAKFTDEEFEATDVLVDPEYAENKEALMSMRDLDYAVGHNHNNESISLSVRFVESYFTPDGVSAERPKQITIPIPIDYWQSIMLEAMVNIGCIITAQEAGKDHDN